MKLLSIVIPTRGREYYCIEVIKDILSYKRKDFELVICDNSDSDQIEDYLVQNNDERVVYQHIHGRINSVINMDTAMRMASGEYVCMIGDDDTILPEIFEVAEWARKNQYDNVTPRYMVTYRWPNAIGPLGTMDWPLYANDGSFKILDCEKQLKAFVNNGLLVYSDYLPRVYHGLVKRSVLDKVLMQTGHIIGGLSPDIYMSIATSCCCNQFVSLFKPITIAGACHSSTTAESNSGGHRGKIDNAPHLYKRGPYIWDTRIPRIYTVQTIWAETAMKAFDELKREDLAKSVNQGFLFAEMIRKNSTLINDIKESVNNTVLIKSRIVVYIDFVWYYLSKSIKRIFRKKIKIKELSDVKDISAAVKIYVEAHS